MERIENPEKYVAKAPILKRTQKFIVKYIMWLPLIAAVLGIISFFKIYTIRSGTTQMPQANYEHIVSRSDYDLQEEDRGKLTHMRDKISEREKADRKGRYDKILSGKDLIAVDFGEHIEPIETTQPKIEDVPEIDSAAVENTTTPVKSKPKIRPKARIKPVEEPLSIPEDSTRVEESREKKHFNTIRISNSNTQTYFRAYVYGEQELVSGGYIKLRLGEPINLDGHKILKGTIFNGHVNLNGNAANILVDRIARFDVNYEVFDADYSYGILLENSPNKDIEDAVNRSIYSSSTGSAADIPYEVVQDITRSIIQSKRQKQNLPKINDGYPVFISSK